MITNDQKNLLINQYSSRGILKEEIRSYEVSLWTLQDSFITVLKWSNVEQKGRIESPIMNIKADGSQSFRFSIPIYYYHNGQKIDNPNWYSIMKERNFISMRKIKVAFNKEKQNSNMQKTFEFLITNITDSHENEIATCNIECDGLAYHELGKIGYTKVLSQDIFEIEYNKWVEANSNTEPPIASLDFWCHTVLDLEPAPLNDEECNPSTWYYDVQMNWDSFAESSGRSSKKLYEENYVTAWNNNLQPEATSGPYVEKARMVSAERSNLYNITQTIAETFGIFCRYEYGHDENNYITSRKIIFYNNFFQEDQGYVSLSYPHTSTKISRTLDGSNISTKLFISDIEDNSIFDGYFSIMNADVNPSRENYILNFDYLLKIGTISQEQYDTIKPFETEMHNLNLELTQLQKNRMAYEERLPRLKATIKTYERGRDNATTQINQSNAILAKLEVDEAADENGYITIADNNPDREFVRTNVLIGNYLEPDTKKKGIDPATIHVYKKYNYTSHEFSEEITGFNFEFDTYGNFYRLVNIEQLPNFTPVFLKYKYRPQLYYEKILQTWRATLSYNTTNLEKNNTELTELEEAIESCNTQIEALVKTKEEKIKEFEEVMGPALREGYWQPEDYKDFGVKKTGSQVITSSSPVTINLTDTGYGFDFAWEKEIYTGEQDVFFYNGININKVYYPYINLSSVSQAVLANITEYSFIYNNIIQSDNSNADAIVNNQIYKVGADAVLMYATTGNGVFPALVLTGAKKLTNSELSRINRASPRLGIVDTQVDEEGLIHTTISNEVSISVSFNSYEAVYPRIKFSSTSLRTESNHLTIRYNDDLLDKYTDYSLLARRIKTGPSSSNYTAAYFITIKPEALITRGLGNILKINYVLSNANTAIYLDAVKVAEKGSQPQVSYELTPNLLGNEMHATLYNKLAQIIMINDVDLKLEDAYGYISELELDLDNIQNDRITVQNYKSTYEDLFSTIISQTDATRFGQKAVDNATSGDVPLADAVFDDMLLSHEGELKDFIVKTIDDDGLVEERITDAVVALSEAVQHWYDGHGELYALTTDNAAILNSFKMNVGDMITTQTFRQEEKPAIFKMGDIWIKTDTNGNELNRYMAVCSSTEMIGEDLNDKTWGFVETFRSSLGQIVGAGINYNAAAGKVEIFGGHNIDIQSGGDIFIGANQNIRMVGNKNVDIGGTTINLCTVVPRIDEDGNPTEEFASTAAGGINLIAGESSVLENETPNVSKISITPKKIDFCSADIIMKAASEIKLISSDNTADNTSGISLSGINGINIAAGRGIRLAGGHVSEDVSVGPEHMPEYKVGHIWIKTKPDDSKEAHKTYDGNPNIDDALNRYYYTEKVHQDKTAIDKVYEATKDQIEVGDNESGVWKDVTSDFSADKIESLLNIASIELNDEHLLMGYQDVALTGVKSTVLKMNREMVIISTGEFAKLNIKKASKGVEVTGFSQASISHPVSGGQTISDYLSTEQNMKDYIGIAGLLIKKNVITMGIDTDKGMSVIAMDERGLTIAGGVWMNVNKNEPKLINLATATRQDIYDFVDDGGQMSYLRVSDSGIELGSKTSYLYIKTANFKIVNGFSENEMAPNTLQQNTVLAFGHGAYNVGANWSLEDLIKYNEKSYPNDDDRITFENTKFAKGWTGSLNVNNSNYSPTIRFAVLNDFSFFKGAVCADQFVSIGQSYNQSHPNASNNIQPTDITINNMQFTNVSRAKRYPNKTPISRITSNTMGFYYSDNPTQLALLGNVDSGDIPMLEFKDGDLYIAGVLDAENILLRFTGVDGMPTLASYLAQIQSQLRNAFNEAGTILQAASSTLQGVAANQYANNAILSEYANKIADLNTTVTDSPTAPSTFKPGDIWNKTKSASDSTVIGTYVAVEYSSPTMVASGGGWTRTSNGAMASVTGTGINIDAEAGNIIINAKSTLELTGNNLEITGEHCINIGSKNINIVTNDTSGGGVFIANTTYSADATLDTNGEISGIVSYTRINYEGITMRSSKVEILAGKTDGTSGLVSAVKLNDEGIFIGANKKIDITTGECEGIVGSGLKMLPDSLELWTVGNSSAGAVSIKANQILLAVGNVLLNYDAQGKVTTPKADVSINSFETSVTGMLIQKDYVGIATQDNQGNRSLVSITPNKIFLGAGVTKRPNTEADQYAGSYLDLEYNLFEIGGTGTFRVLTQSQNFIIDSSQPYLLIQNNDKTNMLQYTTNGLSIRGTIWATAGYIGGVWVKNTTTQLWELQNSLFIGNTFLRATTTNSDESINTFDISFGAASVYFWTGYNNSGQTSLLIDGTLKMVEKSGGQETGSYITIAPHEDSNKYKIIVSGTDNTTTSNYSATGEFKVRTNGYIEANGAKLSAWRLSTTSIRPNSNANVGMHISSSSSHGSIGSTVFFAGGKIGTQSNEDDEEGSSLSPATFRVCADGTIDINHAASDGTLRIGDSHSLVYFIKQSSVTYSTDGTNNTATAFTLVDSKGNELPLNFTNANVLKKFMITKNSDGELNVGAYDKTGVTTSYDTGRLARIHITATPKDVSSSGAYVEVKVAIDNVSTAGKGVSSTLEYYQTLATVPYINISMSDTYNAGDSAGYTRGYDKGIVDGYKIEWNWLLQYVSCTGTITRQETGYADYAEITVPAKELDTFKTLTFTASLDANGHPYLTVYDPGT